MQIFRWLRMELTAGRLGTQLTSKQYAIYKEILFSWVCSFIIYLDCPTKCKCFILIKAKSSLLYKLKPLQKGTEDRRASRTTTSMCGRTREHMFAGEHTLHLWKRGVRCRAPLIRPVLIFYKQAIGKMYSCACSALLTHRQACTPLHCIESTLHKYLFCVDIVVHFLRKWN